MPKKSFYYDYGEGGWRAFDDSSMSEDFIEHIPLYFPVKRYSKHMVWCPRHNAYEEIKSYQKYKLATESCVFEGLVSEPVSYFRKNASGIFNLPLRFRVIRNDESDVVSILQDTAAVNFQSIRDEGRDEYTYIPHIGQLKTECVAIDLKEKKFVPQEWNKDIPLPIVLASLDFLADVAEKIYGQKPTIPDTVKEGKFLYAFNILSAFINYPFNMNLGMLEPYFRYRGYELKEIASSAADDAFSRLCDYFNVLPTENLRETFGKEPLILPFTSVLNALGIKEEHLIRPFLNLKTFMGSSLEKGLKIGVYDLFNRGSRLSFSSDFFADEKNIVDLLSQGHVVSDYASFVFYCHYRLAKDGEEVLAKYLMEINADYSPDFLDNLNLFYHYFLDIPTALKDRIMREGFSLEVHNEMIRSVNENIINPPELTYTEEEQSYECEIDNYEFRLIHDRNEYYSLSMYCWFGRPMALKPLINDGTLRIGIYRGGKAQAYFEHKTNAPLNSHTLGLRYPQLKISDSLRNAFLHFLKRTGLYEKYAVKRDEDMEIFREEVSLNPLREDKYLGLNEIMNMPYEDGYYLRLCEEFKKTDIHCFKVALPAKFTEALEKEYLMAVFPYGKRIYDAAFDGNQEAAYALFQFYADYYPHLIPANEERAEYWHNMSFENRR